MKTQLTSLVNYKSLSVLQFNYEPANTMPIMLGDIAISKGLVTISEVSDSGVVGNIIAENKTDDFVFFSDGDILKGAKQNRTLNTSILMFPHKKVIFPVSCVEQGRWGYKTRRFESEEFSKPPLMRRNMNKEVSENKKQNPKSFNANQAKVWDDVSLYSEAYKLNSITESYSDVVYNLETSFEEFKKQFVYKSDSTGVAFFKNNNLISIDAFNNQNLTQYYFKKLLSGILPDIMWDKKIAKFDEKKCTDSFNYFIKSYLDEPNKLYPGVDAGTEKRFDSEILTGFELTYENKLIHLSILSLN